MRVKHKGDTLGVFNCPDSNYIAIRQILKRTLKKAPNFYLKLRCNTN